ncbi:ABC-type nickel/cobalt efflux system, permease component RcnA [Maridesulfovibrio ferrireducens]|uniref:Nickel/cobalt efflux system n=1 Tax=Maridesulfovibrio ferrireducens TaxID=246191 RepID=A0A1G9BS69_9BACT|nr:nickel ABC transporter permease [Maridesulfovibrio ferrireducens]SDK42341.1 ABC-type nickel/cobalt efflux system, permease component RcnA [Maridesulfovibrio ferrireducens]
MKYKIIFFLLLPLMLITATTSFTPAAVAATNPFLSQKKESVQSPSSKTETAKKFSDSTKIKNNHSKSFYDSAITKVILLQKDIRAKLTVFSRDIKKNSFGKSFWFFLLFSFAYGVVHAVGPGHGKSVVCAYFLSRRGTIYTAVFMSWVITLVHVGSATVAVCLAYLLLSSGMSGFENFNYHLQTASFALVLLIGLWMLFGVIESFFKRNQENRSEPTKCASLKEITAVAFVTGLVPCPGAAIILVYTLSSGILWAGLTAMLFLATGMALTTSIFALTAAKARSFMDRAARGKKAQIFYTAISLSGSLIIISFGALMLSSHL